MFSIRYLCLTHKIVAFSRVRVCAGGFSGGGGVIAHFDQDNNHTNNETEVFSVLFERNTEKSEKVLHNVT